MKQLKILSLKKDLIKLWARPLKRAIQKYLEDNLAEEIINAHLEEEDTIKVSLDKDKLELKMKI